nr:ORF3 [Torque teno felis virus]
MTDLFFLGNRWIRRRKGWRFIVRSGYKVVRGPIVFGVRVRCGRRILEDGSLRQEMVETETLPLPSEMETRSRSTNSEISST